MNLLCKIGKHKWAIQRVEPFATIARAIRTHEACVRCGARRSQARW